MGGCQLDACSVQHELHVSPSQQVGCHLLACLGWLGADFPLAKCSLFLVAKLARARETHPKLEDLSWANLYGQMEKLVVYVRAEIARCFTRAQPDEARGKGKGKRKRKVTTAGEYIRNE